MTLKDTNYRTHDTYTCCRAFGSGAVTTCFNKLGFSRPEIGPKSPAFEENAVVRCIENIIMYRFNEDLTIGF